MFRNVYSKRFVFLGQKWGQIQEKDIHSSSISVISLQHEGLTRLISIFFILLAILVHAVVPHHHHNKLFVSLISSLDAETLRSFEHDHHQHSRESEGCSVNEALQMGVPLFGCGFWNMNSSVVAHEMSAQIFYSSN